MSLIVAVKHPAGILLCADNVFHEGSDGARIIRLTASKLWSVSERVAIGTVGAARLRNVLRAIDWAEIGLQSLVDPVEIEATIADKVVRAIREDQDLKDEKAWALFAVGRHLFQLSADGSVVALAEPYWALGCAELLALGAMHAAREVQRLHAERVNDHRFEIGARTMAELAMSAAAQYMSAIVPPWVWVETTS